MKWVRTAVLALIITAIAIASIAHATTWVFWVLPRTTTQAMEQV